MANGAYAWLRPSSAHKAPGVGAERGRRGGGSIAWGGCEGDLLVINCYKEIPSHKAIYNRNHSSIRS